MAEITAALVKQLRDKTGAGMMECKAALTEANGDMEAAIALLRKRGLASAAKRAGRVTAQGTIGSYIHLGGKIGVMVELSGVTPATSGREEFTTLVKEIAMQVAAASPSYASRDQVAADVLEKEKAIYRAQMENSGKPANVIDKIVEGKLGSFYAQTVLVDQPSIRDPKLSVKDVIAQANKVLGGSIGVTRFVRLKVGEAAQ